MRDMGGPGSDREDGDGVRTVRRDRRRFLLGGLAAGTALVVGWASRRRASACARRSTGTCIAAAPSP